MKKRPPNFSYLSYLFIIKEGQLINGNRQRIITFLGDHCGWISWLPVSSTGAEMATPGGLEPPTCWLEVSGSSVSADFNPSQYHCINATISYRCWLNLNYSVKYSKARVCSFWYPGGTPTASWNEIKWTSNKSHANPYQAHSAYWWTRAWIADDAKR